jgi:transcriptional regulator with XRE-family HTH domain
MPGTIQPELFFCQQRWFAGQHRPLLNGRMRYADRLKRAIQHSKRTQAEVADAAGTTQQVVSAIITRKSDGSMFTAQLAKACGVDPYWLATGNGPMLPNHGGDLSSQALEIARAWSKLPDFKRRTYTSAILTDAAILEIFPELESAMRTALVAVDPDYHRLTEGFIRSRAEIGRQLSLDLKP